MIWLLQQPAVIVGPLIVAVVVGVSVIGLIMFRRAVSHTRLENANPVSTQIFSFARVLYAVLVAFVVVIVWEQFVAAEEVTESEASAIADLLRDSQALPAAMRPQVQQSLTAYVEDLVSDEFPRMHRGESIELESEALNQVWETYQQVQPVTQTELSFYSESISRLNDLGASREVRIAKSELGIPGEMWILLLGGGAVMIAFTYMFGTPNLIVHASAVGLTAALLAFVLFLIISLEFPFVGEVSVTSEAYIRVLESWSSKAPTR